MSDEPECCGTGCTNCVLDLKPVRQQLPLGTVNVLDRAYKEFTCCSIEQETEEVFRFRFRLLNPPDNDSLLVVPEGCHLLLRAAKTRSDTTNQPPDVRLQAWRERHPAAAMCCKSPAPASRIEKFDKSEADLYLSRPYTPVAFQPEERTFDVLIKMEADGAMTDYLLTLRLGSKTEWKGVYGEFRWERNQYRNVVAFAQGVAIAPVYSALRTILDDEEDETRLTLWACFRDLSSLLLRSELRSMAAYWNFKYALYMSRRSCAENDERFSEKIKYNEPIHDRRMEANDIERLLTGLTGDASSLLVLLCGTEPFTRFVKTVLEKLRIENCFTF
ncbi:NADH-cytochrome b5 reductase-like [Anopheles bellator]|uniref:NADH-cytochrome b5 reductase-like n=1 Tax=Anopheles bellator TaxID=139047 RepID=UPI002647D231|nr:NADH-cytochrome b5 reductase-like [Anopheles bellator]